MNNKETFWEKAPFVKGVFDSLELEQHLEITLMESGLFHGDMEIGRWKVLATEISPDHVRHTVAVHLINRIQQLVLEIESEK